jgi:hypothetical protein
MPRDVNGLLAAAHARGARPATVQHHTTALGNAHTTGVEALTVRHIAVHQTKRSRLQKSAGHNWPASGRLWRSSASSAAAEVPCCRNAHAVLLHAPCAAPWPLARTHRSIPPRQSRCGCREVHTGASCPPRLPWSGPGCCCAASRGAHTAARMGRRLSAAQVRGARAVHVSYCPTHHVPTYRHIQDTRFVHHQPTTPALSCPVLSQLRRSIPPPPTHTHASARAPHAWRTASHRARA